MVLTSLGAMILQYFLQGLLLGFAYVAPIGIQNLYLMNTAVRETRKKILEVAVLIIFFDISLALACFFGVGILINTFPGFNRIITLAGSGLLIYIGITLLRSHPQVVDRGGGEDKSLSRIIGMCFAITWFNPQAIIDGSLLLGGFNASLPRSMSAYFILGFCLASCLWFLSLATITAHFRHQIKPAVMRSINLICGAIIIYYGLKLGYAFTKLLP
ncbi:MAG: LysE family transporter [Firmicutes bacterium]|nr:LysE family transporter [Bacillota bacterium]